MQTVKNIMMIRGEECEVDIDVVHEWLTQLPAELYLKLYRKMQEKVIGYPYYVGCCVPTTIENESEENAKHYDEQPVKVEKSYSVGE